MFLKSIFPFSYCGTDLYKLQYVYTGYLFLQFPHFPSWFTSKANLKNKTKLIIIKVLSLHPVSAIIKKIIFKD